jgi:hypothetical protein
MTENREPSKLAQEISDNLIKISRLVMDADKLVSEASEELIRLQHLFNNLKGKDGDGNDNKST